MVIPTLHICYQEYIQLVFEHNGPMIVNDIMVLGWNMKVVVNCIVQLIVHNRQEPTGKVKKLALFPYGQKLNS